MKTLLALVLILSSLSSAASTILLTLKANDGEEVKIISEKPEISEYVVIFPKIRAQKGGKEFRIDNASWMTLHQEICKPYERYAHYYNTVEEKNTFQKVLRINSNLSVERSDARIVMVYASCMTEPY